MEEIKNPSVIIFADMQKKQNVVKKDPYRVSVRNWRPLS